MKALSTALEYCIVAALEISNGRMYHFMSDVADGVMQKRSQSLSRSAYSSGCVPSRITTFSAKSVNLLLTGSDLVPEYTQGRASRLLYEAQTARWTQENGDVDATFLNPYISGWSKELSLIHI